VASILIAVIAFVISLVSAVAAVVSALSSRRSAAAAEKSAEADRRMAEASEEAGLSADRPAIVFDAVRDPERNYQECLQVAVQYGHPPGRIRSVQFAEGQPTWFNREAFPGMCHRIPVPQEVLKQAIEESSGKEVFYGHIEIEDERGRPWRYPFEYDLENMRAFGKKPVLLD